MTEQHARAAANVRFALMNHDSFVVITGEIGTGKTTVLNTALRELGSQYVAARIVHTTLSDIELLQSLLSEFGIPNYSTKKVKLLDDLRHFFLEQHLAGRHVVIIVDEAQHLNPAALEELRLLSCIDSQDRRIVSIVLTGQPALDEVLDDPSLAQLRQRTRLRQRLRPMDASVTADYIRHRLKVAGGNADEIFAPETYPEIHRLTLGIPRLINTLCDTALTACMVEKRNRVDLATIEAVVQELGWRWAEASGRRKRDPGELPAGRAPADDRAALLVHLPGKLVARVDIANVPFAIGRSHGNGLVIEEKEISRRHALIDRVGTRYVIEDLNSRNGVLVNGKRCEMANLKSGDVITIGGVKLVFQLKDEVGDDTGEHGEVKVSNVIAFGETQRLPDDMAPAEDLGTRQAKE
jgi:type II secretory pathway predicted ATPase ExeA